MRTEQRIAPPENNDHPVLPGEEAVRSSIYAVVGNGQHHDPSRSDPRYTASSMLTRKNGSKRKIPPEIERELHAALCDNLPCALGLPYAFWTREAVLNLVERRIDGSIPSRTLFTYLDRWGFTPRSPLQQAYQEEPGLVRAWMRNEYPTIAMQAKVDRAELMWLGTLNLVPKSITVRQERAHGSSLIKAPHLTRTHVLTYLVTNRHRYSWVVHDPRSTPSMITLLLEQVQQESGRPLMVIARDLPALRDILGEVWCESRQPRIQVRWM